MNTPPKQENSTNALYKRVGPLSPESAQKTWKVLEDAIDKIYNENVSSLSFEELYRHAYNLVAQRHGKILYDGLVNTLTQHIRESVQSVESAQGELFLEELNNKWLEHNRSLGLIRDILMYVDRVYVIKSKETPVHGLGLNLWRDNIVRSPKIKDRLVGSLLDLVQRERTGEVINRGLMRNITKMFLDLGQEVYEENFERPFLESAADFYRLESQQYVETSDCSDYLKNAERRRNEEIERVTHYLAVQSEPKITAVVLREMISNHTMLLVEMENSGLLSMLIHDQYDDLARMYNLLRHDENLGLKVIRDCMTNHLRETGRQLVMDPERLKEPLEFVQRLFDKLYKYGKAIESSFNNDKTFHHALNLSFEYFINLNSRSPEFLSLFVDDKLRKGLKDLSEEEVEAVLEKVMMLFRYLQDKDLFERYYKQHLAKRLLSGRTVSDDAERSLIMKLKTECGNLFTSKLESMFNDLKISTDTMQGFYGLLSTSEASEGPTLAVRVLTAGSWPADSGADSGARCNLPTEIFTMCDKFKAYYLSTHTGRRLTWQTNMGTADLKATFGNGQKHELNVSTYQMCILLLFNVVDKLSYREIEAGTDIPSKDLKRNLQSLACVKGKNVLRKEPMSKDISEDDWFLFNDTFASKFYKVKIGTVAAQESEPENQETRHKVEEDRKPQIEAAIVRIMKSRRVLDHNSIISEVTKQLQARFLANPAVIKKQIESLIEREFIKRDTGNRKLYQYVA